MTPRAITKRRSTYLNNRSPSCSKSATKRAKAPRLTIFRKFIKPRAITRPRSTYLKQSLAIYQQIGDKAGEGTTLNNISQIYDAQGDYATALDLPAKSLAISQQIGDKAGEGTTLNNISALITPRAITRPPSTYLINPSPSISKSATKPAKAPPSTIFRKSTTPRAITHRPRPTCDNPSPSGSKSAKSRVVCYPFQYRPYSRPKKPIQEAFSAWVRVM